MPKLCTQWILNEIMVNNTMEYPSEYLFANIRVDWYLDTVWVQNECGVA